MFVPSFRDVAIVVYWHVEMHQIDSPVARVGFIGRERENERRVRIIIMKLDGAKIGRRAAAERPQESGR